MGHRTGIPVSVCKHDLLLSAVRFGWESSKIWQWEGRGRFIYLFACL
jgi:hypothetical protein